jgi:uncharacterized protein DUF3830
MKRIEIEIDGVKGEAELLEENAPKTAAAFWGALPLETRLRHDKWSGRACGFSVEGLRSVNGLEHAVCSIYPGTFIARPDKAEVLVSYGPAEYRSVLGVEYGTRIARLVRNQAAVLAALEKMHDEGDKTIKVRRAAGG